MSWKRNKLAKLGRLPLTANQQPVAQVCMQACSVPRSTHPASRSCNLLMPSRLANWAPVFMTVFPVPPALVPWLKGFHQREPGVWKGRASSSAGDKAAGDAGVV